MQRMECKSAHMKMQPLNFQELGLRVIGLRQRRHTVVRLAGPGGECNWVMARTPSDWRAERNNLAVLKRIAKRLGVN